SASVASRSSRRMKMRRKTETPTVMMTATTTSTSTSSRATRSANKHARLQKAHVPCKSGPDNLRAVIFVGLEVPLHFGRHVGMLEEHLLDPSVGANDRQLDEVGEEGWGRRRPAREVLHEEQRVRLLAAEDVRRVRVEAAVHEEDEATAFGLEEKRRL